MKDCTHIAVSVMLGFFTPRLHVGAIYRVIGPNVGIIHIVRAPRSFQTHMPVCED